ncbi:MAG: thiosulfate oxidation carrier complex protein SoxZ [Rhodospirillales bacterium]|jgi:sulfur-oxidizing protein SoxZ|nr:thiosulfate oxidation carrier complex protein SoxZ [Rhodospirillales bacterium]
MPKGPQVRIPKTARKGEVVPVKTKIGHPMETGWRKGKDGTPVARNRINRFVCAFNGEDVFKSDFDAGVAADPYLAFFVKVEESGRFEFTWVEDGGRAYTRSASIVVT